MRRRTLERLIAELGEPKLAWPDEQGKAFNYRWSVPRAGLPNLNVSLDDWAHSESARIWLFDPASPYGRCIDAVSVSNPNDLECLIQRIREHRSRAPGCSPNGVALVEKSATAQIE